MSIYQVTFYDSRLTASQDRDTQQLSGDRYWRYDGWRWMRLTVHKSRSAVRSIDNSVRQISSKCRETKPTKLSHRVHWCPSMNHDVLEAFLVVQPRTVNGASVPVLSGSIVFVLSHPVSVSVSAAGTRNHERGPAC